MFAYYLDLAFRSFRRNKALTTLMVLGIALGIGAAMTTLTVFHVLSGDPLPDRSHTLFYPQLDPRSMDGYTPGDDPEYQMTRRDAENLLRDAKGDRQAVMTGGSLAVEPTTQGLSPFIVDARYTSADFFPMFDTPFQHGTGWDKGADDRRERVAVLSSELNEQLFGEADSVGRTVRLDGNDFRVVGVLDDWRPTPRFYDMNMDRFGEVEQVFIPLSTAIDLRLGRNGSMNCWSDGNDEDDPEGQIGLNAPCTWLQYWVELRTPEQVEDYRQYLANYSDAQRAAGRYERPTNVRLHDLMGWLEYNEVVPSDVRLQVWLAFGFLAVCLLNTVGLLLAKFLRRSSEIGVRRALGASRRA
ncbi:MAG TPA: ABC transporter permease, partial [Xanthomonadaceae bacterium]|nr:ABC transporter permease [Xanthomonadaceae bacterium]